MSPHKITPPTGARLAAALVLAAAGGLSGVGARAVEPAAQPVALAVTVPSRDVRAGAAVQQPAFWFPVAAPAPAGVAASAPASASASAPALVLLHGCGGPYERGGGLSSRMRDYAQWLNAQGVSVLVTDSLTPRGETELCTQKNGSRQVTQTQRRRDALGALQWLASQAGVDARRVGLLGWSNGGSTVLAALNSGHPEVAAAPVRASLAVAFYPGCEQERQRGFAAAAPLLLLLGEADDWTPPGPCLELAAQARPGAAAAGIEIERYAGAYHGFDSSAPVRLRRDVPNGSQPGQGVHVGGDPAALAASRLALARFLRQHWALTPP